MRRGASPRDPARPSGAAGSARGASDQSSLSPGGFSVGSRPQVHSVRRVGYTWLSRVRDLCQNSQVLQGNVACQLPPLSGTGIIPSFQLVVRSQIGGWVVFQAVSTATTARGSKTKPPGSNLPSSCLTQGSSESQKTGGVSIGGLLEK